MRIGWLHLGSYSRHSFIGFLGDFRTACPVRVVALRRDDVQNTS